MNGRTVILAVICIELSTALLVGSLLAAQGKLGLGVLMGTMILLLPFVLIPTVMISLSRISGWTRLGEQFPSQPASPDATRPQLTSIALRFPMISYNNIVEWRADADHLHLALPPIFNAGHRPLSIPWYAVESIEPARFGAVKLRVLDTALWVPERCVRMELAIRERLANLKDGQIPQSAEFAGES